MTQSELNVLKAERLFFGSIIGVALVVMAPILALSYVHRNDPLPPLEVGDYAIPIPEEGIIAVQPRVLKFTAEGNPQFVSPGRETCLIEAGEHVFIKAISGDTAVVQTYPHHFFSRPKTECEGNWLVRVPYKDLKHPPPPPGP